MLAILMMARVLPPRESTGAILPMLVLADVFAISIYHQHARGSFVSRMIPPALVGIICGWLLMPHIPAQSFGPFYRVAHFSAHRPRARPEVCPAADEFRR